MPLSTYSSSRIYGWHYLGRSFYGRPSTHFGYSRTVLCCEQFQNKCKQIEVVGFQCIWSRKEKRHLDGYRSQTNITSSLAELIWFLGIYFSQKKQIKLIMDIVRGKIEQVINILKWKKVTDIQTYYILNMILKSQIEFCLMNTFLPKSTCKKLTSTYIKYFKNAISSSSIISNIILLLLQLYNISSVQQIQLTIQIMTLINCLNDTGPLGIIARIYLKELQLHSW